MDKKVTIFAGNQCADDRAKYYYDLAYKTGQLFAQNGFVVVTGAGMGLMDEVSRGAIEARGQTIGIGLNLAKRVQSKYASSLSLYDKLSPRQDKLIALGDAYVALPGGIGTLYEINSILALKKIGEMPLSKPLVLVDGYYGILKDVFIKMIEDGFVDQSLYSLFHLVDTPEQALRIVKSGLSVV